MTDILLKVFRGPPGPQGVPGTYPLQTFRQLLTGPNYTLTSDDYRSYFDIPSASGVTGIVIPTEASVPLDLGSEILIGNQKASAVTIARVSGVALLHPGTNPFAEGNGSVAAGGVARLVKIATNAWIQLTD